jgi:hypothetical protein
MKAQQVFSPSQIYSPAQVYSPATTYAQQLDMTAILNAILPIMMLAMVFGMIVPMMKSVTRGMSS